MLGVIGVGGGALEPVDLAVLGCSVSVSEPDETSSSQFSATGLRAFSGLERERWFKDEDTSIFLVNKFV
jgi:hypothetical protein